MHPVVCVPDVSSSLVQKLLKQLAHKLQKDYEQAKADLRRLVGPAGTAGNPTFFPPKLACVQSCVFFLSRYLIWPLTWGRGTLHLLTVLLPT